MSRVPPGARCSPLCWARCGHDFGGPLAECRRRRSSFAGQAPPGAASPNLPHVEVRVLGNLELELDGGRVADLGGTKPRTLLGVLIAASGHPVLVPRLIDQVWDDDPPDRVEASLQTYVARLRKTLGGPTGAGARLLTHSGGYSLELEPHELDASRFTTGVANAVGLVAAGDDAAADRALVDALALWRGEAYSGLPSRLLDAEAARLSEMRVAAEVSLWDLRVRSGRHVEAVSALEQLVRLHPFSEPFWYLLALSLYRTGRQRDALAALRRARTILADELGIDPGRDLQQLELQVLQQDPTLLAYQRSSASLSAPTTVEASESNVQRDLGGAALVGRDEEMATALQALDQAIAGRGGLLVVTGQPGIGKSRIVSEVLDVAAQRGVRVGRGRWDPDPGPPLAGWRSALNGALGADDVLAPAADDGVRDAASEVYRLADALERAAPRPTHRAGVRRCPLGRSRQPSIDSALHRPRRRAARPGRHRRAAGRAGRVGSPCRAVRRAGARRRGPLGAGRHGVRIGSRVRPHPLGRRHPDRSRHRAGEPHRWQPVLPRRIGPVARRRRCAVRPARRRVDDGADRRPRRGASPARRWTTRCDIAVAGRVRARAVLRGGDPATAAPDGAAQRRRRSRGGIRVSARARVSRVRWSQPLPIRPRPRAGCDLRGVACHHPRAHPCARRCCVGTASRRALGRPRR